MRKMIIKLAACFALAAATSAQALPIVQADAFTTGDNKAALETSTGLVWMDFGVITNQAFEQVISKLDTDYNGWRLPTEEEVKNLFAQLIPTASWYSNNVYHVESGDKIVHWKEVYDIWGMTFSRGDVIDNAAKDWDVYLGGIFLGNDQTTHKISLNEFIDQIGSSNFIHDYLFWHQINTRGNPLYDSVLLVKKDRHSVPEPSSLVLLSLSLLGLGFTRRTKK